jgi:acyl CoA:acetate/3-ketoacid CoA transferase beta subunit
LTSIRPVSLIVTDLAVIEPTPEGPVLRERAPGVAIDSILEATGTRLIVPEVIGEMNVS